MPRSVSSIIAATRARRVAERRVVVARSRGAASRGSRARASASRLAQERALHALDLLGEALRRPGRVQEAEVEREVELVAGAVVARDLGRVQQVDLADGRALVVVVEHRAHPPQHRVDVRVVLVVASRAAP